MWTHHSDSGSSLARTPVEESGLACLAQPVRAGRSVADTCPGGKVMGVHPGAQVRQARLCGEIAGEPEPAHFVDRDSTDSGGFVPSIRVGPRRQISRTGGPGHSPRDARASLFRTTASLNGKSHGPDDGASSSIGACARSGNTTESCRVAARSTRPSANSRHEPHPSPAPSRSATRVANAAESPYPDWSRNSAAASTSCRSVTQLHRQTYTARPCSVELGTECKWE